MISVTEAARLCDRVLTEVGRAVVGKRGQLSLILAGILAGGHVLIEDNPGLAKTLAARSFAQASGLLFRRVQFTPDLLPSDITGSFVYDQSKNEFAFRSGPLFAGLLLADEINRTPPKTQAALLEAMQEGQATVEGRTFELPKPFHVIATANPIEYEGTYPLPEAQLDRFLIRVAFGYPSKDEEWQVLQRRMQRRTETITVSQVLDAEQLQAIQQVAETVEVSENVGRYCVDLVDATRFHQHLLVGSSPRGALALLLVARAYALIHHRDYVTPDDVKAVAVPALAHRITLRPEMWMRNLSPADVIEGVLKSVAAPDSDRRGYSAVGRR
ncbi:MAG: AAA family ATPase [Jatrophihabitantaceae bacterium]